MSHKFPSHRRPRHHAEDQTNAISTLKFREEMAGVEFSFYVLFIAFFLSGKINNLQFHSCTRSLSYSRALLHYLQFYLEWKKKLYQANNHIAYLDESDDLVITTDFCT